MNCIICIIVFVLHLYMTMESCYIDGQNPLLLMKCQTRINSNKHEHTDTMSCIMYIRLHVLHARINLQPKIIYSWRKQSFVLKN